MTRFEQADVTVASLYGAFTTGSLDKWEYYGYLRALVDARHITIRRICEIVPTKPEVVRMRLRDLLHT